MNQRIKELIKQSYVTIESPSGEWYTDFSKEKFAELIVRECADQVSDYFSEYYSRYASEKIKEHFGVEE